MPVNKIVIVDNDPGVLHLLESALQSKYSANYSMDIWTFKDCSEALDNLEGSRIVITDLKMFPMDGFEFIEQARLRGYKGEIVICSAFSDTDSEIDLMNAKSHAPITPIFHKSDYLRILTYIVNKLVPRPPR